MIDTINITLEAGYSVLRTLDTVYDENKTYWKIDYILMSLNSWDDPTSKKLYEALGNMYVLTTDTEVDNNKNYYSKSYVEVDPLDIENPSEQGFLEVTPGLTISNPLSVLSLIDMVPPDEIQEAINDPLQGIDAFGVLNVYLGGMSDGVFALDSSYSEGIVTVNITDDI